MEQVKINVVATKKNAKKALSLMDENRVNEIALAAVTKEQLADFVVNKRKNLAVFEVNGQDLFEVEGTLEGANLLIKLLEEVEETEMPFPPIPRINIEDFITNKRSSLLTLDLVHMDKETDEDLDDIEEVEPLPEK